VRFFFIGLSFSSLASFPRPLAAVACCRSPSSSFSRPLAAAALQSSSFPRRLAAAALQSSSFPRPLVASARHPLPQAVRFRSLPQPSPAAASPSSSFPVPPAAVACCRSPLQFVSCCPLLQPPSAAAPISSSTLASTLPAVASSPSCLSLAAASLSHLAIRRLLLPTLNCSSLQVAEAICRSFPPRPNRFFRRFVAPPRNLSPAAASAATLITVSLAAAFPLSRSPPLRCPPTLSLARCLLVSAVSCLLQHPGHLSLVVPCRRSSSS